MIEEIAKLRQHLLTGVSYAIPFIACGGIMIAFAIAFAPMTPKGPDFSQSPTLTLINRIGAVSFSLMLPVLAGYIAYSIADSPRVGTGLYWRLSFRRSEGGVPGSVARRVVGRIYRERDQENPGF
jgi:hypothetical protein